MTRRTVIIHYRRLPGDEHVYRQPLLHEAADHVVTFLESADLSAPLIVEGRVLLEAGSPVIWFTFPGRWYDIGRFHRSDGTFTGHYANLLTPVRMQDDRWETTDLCLDVWSGSDGLVRVLDEDDFAQAVRHGWIDPLTARIARAQADALAAAATHGDWPPEHVRDWTLERARSVLGERS